MDTSALRSLAIGAGMCMVLRDPCIEFELTVRLEPQVPRPRRLRPISRFRS